MGYEPQKIDRPPSARVNNGYYSYGSFFRASVLENKKSRMYTRPTGALTTLYNVDRSKDIVMVLMYKSMGVTWRAFCSAKFND